MNPEQSNPKPETPPQRYGSPRKSLAARTRARRLDGWMAPTTRTPPPSGCGRRAGRRSASRPGRSRPAGRRLAARRERHLEPPLERGRVAQPGGARRDDRHGMRPDEIEHRQVPRQLPGRQPPRIAARVKWRGLSADDDVAPPAALLQHGDCAPVEHLRLDAADEPPPVRDRHAGEPERDVGRVCRRGRVHRPQRGRPQPERRDRHVDDRPPRRSGLALNPVRLGHGTAAVPGRAIGRRPGAAAPDRKQRAHGRRPAHYPMR